MNILRISNRSVSTDLSNFLKTIDALVYDGFIKKADNGHWAVNTDKMVAHKKPPQGNRETVLQLLRQGQQQGAGLFDAPALAAYIEATGQTNQITKRNGEPLTDLKHALRKELQQMAALGVLQHHPKQTRLVEVSPPNIQQGTKVEASTIPATTVVVAASTEGTDSPNQTAESTMSSALDILRRCRF
jgi:hypothetical protein